MRTSTEITSNWSESDVPDISVICLTYNHAEYIAQALQGILLQKTRYSFEVIVHDDASTDGTSDIVKEYAERYPDIIRHVRQEVNQYSQGKRMITLALPYVRGRYIALCDGDDSWTDPNKLQKQVDFLEKNPDYVITYHDCVPFDESGHISVDYGGATRDLSSRELQQATPVYTLTSCFRNVIKEFPGEFFTARYGDLFRLSLLGAYGKGKFMEDIEPAKYRVHEGGVFSKKTYSQKLEMKMLTDAALLAYYRRIRNKEMADYFRNQTLISCAASSPYASLFRVFIWESKERLKRLFWR